MASIESSRPINEILAPARFVSRPSRTGPYGGLVLDFERVALTGFSFGFLVMTGWWSSRLKGM
jgi:hypothetical protein